MSLSEMVAASFFEQSHCDGTPGLATQFFPVRDDIQDITEVCFNEAAGVFQFSDPLPNMTLVAQTPDGRRFEDLTQPSDGDRSAIDLHRATDLGELCGEVPDGFERLYGLIYNTPAGGPSDNGSVIGYLLDAPSEPQNGISYSFASLGTNIPSRIDDIPAHEYDGKMDLSLAFLGSVTPSQSDIGTFVIEQVEDTNLGSYDGQIRIVHLGNGEVTMTGHVETTTSRIAGLEPLDWKAASYELVGFRGNAFGDNGQFIQLYGWIDGSFIDESGAIHPFRADASFQACSTPE